MTDFGQILRHALTQPEGRTLLTGGVVAAGLWAAIEGAEAMLFGGAPRLDRALLRAVRGAGDAPVGPRWLEPLARDYTALGSVGVLALLVLGTAGYLWLRRRGPVAAFLLGTVGGGLVLNTLLKVGVDRPRPAPGLRESTVFSPSFPSGHAALAAVTYLTLGALLASTHSRRGPKRYLLGGALLIPGTVGVTRVYLGVHWPTDVCAGWALGAAWALCCWVGAAGLRDAPDGQERPPA